MSKHTPGEWTTSPKFKFHVTSKSGRGICSTGGYSNNQDSDGVEAENVANARLIAAAPDLLAACEAALTFNTRADMSLPEYVSRGAELNKQLRAAITKAGGSQ